MRIEIITTGDEVMQGVIVDTNTAWIAERCARLGHEVIRHSSVADDLDAMGGLCLDAAKRSDCVIVTGGLGPTADDMTVEAAASAFGLKMHTDEAALAAIRRRFEKLGRRMSPSNEKQALIPDGGMVIKNDIGTAPGVRLRRGRAEFFFLPGVPKEMYRMFEESVEPWLAGMAKGACKAVVLRCFGLPEADIDEKLKGVDLCGTRLSFRVSFPEILLKVVSRATSESDAAGNLNEAAAAIRARLGDFIYGEGDLSLAEVVGNMLADRKLTISVAESCTGGLLASTITDVAGASRYFDRGAVSYSNDSKIELLGVSKETLESHGAVSTEVAREMADGIRAKSGSSIGIGVTGIAGPGGATTGKPVGTVHVALSGPLGVEDYSSCIPRDRIWFKQYVVAKTLDMVRRYLKRLISVNNG